jgi:hypothetical protein
MTEQNQSDNLMDKFERTREVIWGQPGFQRRNSTIISSGWTFFPQATWIVETIKTDDTSAIFLQCVDKDGGQRIVLPDRVVIALYRHYESIMKSRRKVRAQRGAETRKKKQQ